MNHYLIVGQGLAGTLLAYFLLKKGQQVHLIDSNYERAASKVAAGIINPITGRRFVKSWKVDELLPFAAQTYHEMEQLLGVNLFYKKNILRAIFNQKEENDWLARSILPSFAPYVVKQPNWEKFRGKIVKSFGFSELKATAQVDIKTLIENWRLRLKQQNIIREDLLEYDQIDVSLKDKLRYKDVFYKKIIFCEGYQVAQNPFFNYLPFQPAKGEVLIVRIDDFPTDKMLKHKTFLVPLPNNLFWVGSNYEWHFESDQPSKEGRKILETRLKKVLQVPFEIVEHWAAVRPTVYNRRPFLGLHPKFSQLAIFNGLGTKGASLGPYFAHEMAAFLVEGKALDEEVDVRNRGL